MKSGFLVTVVVTVRSHGLYIEDGFVVLWHGASDEMLSKLEVVLEVIVRFLGCVYEWLARCNKRRLVSRPDLTPMLCYG